MKPDGLIRMWLNDNARQVRQREAKTRKAFACCDAGSIMARTYETLADCHAAAALIYETELSKLGPEKP
jgi:hypothetical protein